MPTRKPYINVPVEAVYFPALKELKLRYAGALGREATWSEFLKWLCDSVFGERERGELAVWNLERATEPLYSPGTATVPGSLHSPDTEGQLEYAKMGQPEPGGVERSMTPEELDASGVRQDDVLAVEMARMTLGSVFISERSCQRIADILLEKIKGQA